MFAATIWLVGNTRPLKSIAETWAGMLVHENIHSLFSSHHPCAARCRCAGCCQCAPLCLVMLRIWQGVAIFSAALISAALFPLFLFYGGVSASQTAVQCTLAAIGYRLCAAEIPMDILWLCMQSLHVLIPFSVIVIFIDASIDHVLGDSSLQYALWAVVAFQLLLACGVICFLRMPTEAQNAVQLDLLTHSHLERTRASPTSQQDSVQSASLLRSVSNVRAAVSAHTPSNSLADRCRSCCYACAPTCLLRIRFDNLSGFALAMFEFWQLSAITFSTPTVPWPTHQGSFELFQKVRSRCLLLDHLFVDCCTGPGCVSHCCAVQSRVHSIDLLLRHCNSWCGGQSFCAFLGASVRTLHQRRG